MIAHTQREKPRPDRLAAMASWLRETSDTPWTYSTDSETVLYRIECRFLGGVRGFDRQVMGR